MRDILSDFDRWHTEGKQMAIAMAIQTLSLPGRFAAFPNDCVACLWQAISKTINNGDCFAPPALAEGAREKARNADNIRGLL